MHYIRGTKKWRRKVVSLLLIGSLIVGVSQTDVKISAHSDEERTYEDGVYIGSGTGFKLGTTTVKVTVKDDKIVSVEEVSTEDTKSYFQRAKVIMNQIVEKNSLDVDTVSGATYSCNGILRATKDALNQAKINKNGDIFAKGDGTKENPFVIDTEKQLRNFANSLTEDIDYQGLYISLGDDITLSSEKWIPIGNHEYSFEGYFDGQNHVVSGMAIGTKEEPHNIKNGEVYNGFFSVLGEHAYVKNLHLTNMSINVQYEASSYAGGITGYMNKGGIVDGCSVTGRISNHAKKGNNFAGGIAGYVYKGKIINSNFALE